MPVETHAVLEFLLVSSEESTTSAMQSAFADIGGTLKCETSGDVAREFLKTHKVDGVILDIDLKYAIELIGEMRRTKNARAFAFFCVSNEAESAVALKSGANALLKKPLTPEAIFANVNAFKSIIVSERRRYQRHDVTLPVVIGLGDNTYQGIIENISQGGMAVRLPCLLPADSLVEVSFELDSGCMIEGCAQLRWANNQGISGLEFRELTVQSKKELMIWLRNRASAQA